MKAGNGPEFMKARSTGNNMLSCVKIGTKSSLAENIENVFIVSE